MTVLLILALSLSVVGVVHLLGVLSLDQDEEG